jgi:hypothetical protein
MHRNAFSWLNDTNVTNNEPHRNISLQTQKKYYEARYSTPTIKADIKYAIHYLQHIWLRYALLISKSKGDEERNLVNKSSNYRDIRDHTS